MTRSPRLANILLREVTEEEDISRCPNCGADNVIDRNDFLAANHSIIQTQACYNCKHEWWLPGSIGILQKNRD